MPPAAKGGGGSGAVRAGRAFVELFAQDNKLYRALDAASARLKKFGAMSAKIGLAASAGGSAILAPMAKVFTDAAGRGAKIDQLAKRFGVTTESVSSLAYAFETSGVSLEEFEGVMDGVAGKVRSAADANEELIEGLKGLNGRSLIAMPIDKQLDRITDAFSRITNPIDQATVAQDLFGASGLRMLEVLKRGSAGLAERKAAAGPGGGLVSQADASRSTALLKAYTEVWQSVKYTLLEVGAALLPVGDGIGSVSDQVKKTLTGVRGWIGSNKELIQTTAKVAVGVVAGGVALVAFGAILTATGTLVGVVVLPLKLLALGILAVGSAIGVAVTLVTGFAGHLLLVAGIGAILVGLFADDLSAGFKSFATDAKEAWGGIVEAMSRGDLGAAAGLGLALVNSEWAKAVLFWTKTWNGFKDTFLDGWRSVVDAIAGGLASIGESLGVLPEGTVGTISDMQKEQSAANKKAREQDVKAAEAELEAAKKRLEAANAAARGGGKDWVSVGLSAFPGIGAAAKAAAAAAAAAKKPAPPKLPTPDELFNAVKGTFTVPMARQQLAYGDNAQKRQLDAAVNTAKNTAVLPEIRQGIHDLGKNLAFK